MKPRFPAIPLATLAFTALAFTAGPASAAPGQGPGGRPGPARTGEGGASQSGPSPAPQGNVNLNAQPPAPADTLAAATVAACPGAGDWTPSDWVLPAVKARLAAHQPLKIVALGAASTAGSAAGGAAFAYPARLEARLNEAMPGASFAVVNAGVPGDSTAEMVTRLGHGALDRDPALVIWEVGTLEAVHDSSLESFDDELGAGIALLKRRHVDVVLMDMQYAPGAASIIDYGPYIDIVHRHAETDSVGMFERFDIMRWWHETGLLDLTAQRGSRPALPRRVYDCLARILADGIEKAVR